MATHRRSPGTPSGSPNKQTVILGLLVITLSAIFISGLVRKLKGKTESTPTSIAETSPTTESQSQSQAESAGTPSASNVSRPSSAPSNRAVSASAPLRSAIDRDLQSGRYRVLDSDPAILSLETEGEGRVSALKSEIKITACSFDPKSACAILGDQQVLLSQELKSKLPARKFLSSPWNGPILPAKPSANN